MAGGTDPNGCDCKDSDDTDSASRSPGAICVVAGGTDTITSDCTGSDGAGSTSRPKVAISLVADGTDPNKSECTGSDGENEEVIDRTLAVFRGEGLPSTVVGRFLGLDDSV